jgi:molybdopterin converting factor small subunit
MSRIVMISPLLQEYHHIPGVLRVEGETVGECLNDLFRQYPEAKEWLFDKQGVLQIMVYINGEENIIYHREDFSRKLNRGDELQIVPVIYGG